MFSYHFPALIIFLKFYSFLFFSTILKSFLNSIIPPPAFLLLSNHLHSIIRQKMRVKELVRWLNSFDLSPTPWAVDPPDWATGLNLLARLLHSTLAKRVEEEQQRKEEEKKEETEHEEEEEDDDGSSRENEEEKTEGDEKRRRRKKTMEEDHQQLIKRRQSPSHPSTQLALQEVCLNTKNFWKGRVSLSFVKCLFFNYMSSNNVIFGV